MKSKKISTVIFDLTGVLYEFQGPKMICEVAKRKVSLEEFSEFWTTNKTALEFTRGMIGGDEFAKGAIDAFKLPCERAQFIENFQRWFIGPYNGVKDVIRDLRKGYVVACLSNTHEFDVARYRKIEKLPKLFDRCFFSNEIGYAKPETEAYETVIEALDIKPEETLFLDDSLNCVLGAQEVGLVAEQVCGFEEVKECLARYDIT